MRNAYIILVGKPAGKRPLGTPGQVLISAFPSSFSQSLFKKQMLIFVTSVSQLISGILNMVIIREMYLFMVYLTTLSVAQII
jgi:hypothetical protein